MTEAATAPPPLPDDAPPELRDFLECSIDQVDLDFADRSWIPKPPHVPDSLIPSVTVDPDWTPTRAKVNVGYGFLAIHLAVEIEDGRLHAHTARLPFGIGHEITDGIHEWIRTFNATLDSHGKQLDRMDVTHDTVTVTKRSRPS